MLSLAHRRVAVGGCRVICPDRAARFDQFSELTSHIRSKTARNRVRVKANFVSGIMLIWVVQSPLVNLFRLCRRANHLYDLAPFRPG
jgi:hypothetical protein